MTEDDCDDVVGEVSETGREEQVRSDTYDLYRKSSSSDWSNKQTVF